MKNLYVVFADGVPARDITTTLDQLEALDPSALIKVYARSGSRIARTCNREALPAGPLTLERVLSLMSKAVQELGPVDTVTRIQASSTPRFGVPGNTVRGALFHATPDGKTDTSWWCALPVRLQQMETYVEQMPELDEDGLGQAMVYRTTFAKVIKAVKDPAQSLVPTLTRPQILNAAIDVVVTCHPAYLHFLPEVLKAWDREKPGGKKLLVLDNVDGEVVADGWEIIRTNSGHPSTGRRKATAKATADWVIYWDADNDVPKGVVESARKVLSDAQEEDGYFGPSVKVGSDPRDAFGVDTNGMWRTKAVRMAGDWMTTPMEDWALFVRMSAIGYRAQPWPNSGIVRKVHDLGQRTQAMPIESKAWGSRTMTIVTLQRTFEGLTKWIAEFRRQETPSQEILNLIVVWDGGRTDLHKARQAIAQIQKVSSSTVLWSGGQAVTFRKVPEPVRHARVNGLFLKAAQHVPKDSAVVLTWEDDVIPKSAQALRRLSDGMPTGSRVGAIGGAYPGRQNPRFVVASTSTDQWQAPFEADSLPKKRIEVASIGCGFTLWRASVFLSVLGPDQHPEIPKGFDMICSMTATKLGWKVILDGGVPCDHLSYV